MAVYEQPEVGNDRERIDAFMAARTAAYGGNPNG